MEQTVQVTEKMGSFIEWAYNLGEEEVRKRVREKIIELRDMPKNTRDKDGFSWDERLEPNDGIDQYKHGGDCNLCKRLKYCLTKCGANKALKKITTPYLYQLYLEEHPEIAAEAAQKSITPDDLLDAVGAEDGHKLLS